MSPLEYFKWEHKKYYIHRRYHLELTGTSQCQVEIYCHKTFISFYETVPDRIFLEIDYKIIGNEFVRRGLSVFSEDTYEGEVDTFIHHIEDD